MIQVRSPLEIKVDPEGGWQLMFWVLDSFNYATPFRNMLADIADGLGQNPDSDLQLPLYEMNEDFVEGTLRFGDTHLRIYYEHSLSYLSLMSDNESVLRDIVARIQSRITIV
ncbi:hypothetical protein ACIPPQ_18565 [Sphingopyxis sp. LARHCG72]|jgi:hypothetical protein